MKIFNRIVSRLKKSNTYRTLPSWHPRKEYLTGRMHHSPILACTRLYATARIDLSISRIHIGTAGKQRIIIFRGFDI